MDWQDLTGILSRKSWVVHCNTYNYYTQHLQYNLIYPLRRPRRTPNDTSSSQSHTVHKFNHSPTNSLHFSSHKQLWCTTGHVPERHIIPALYSKKVIRQPSQAPCLDQDPPSTLPPPIRAMNRTTPNDALHKKVYQLRWSTIDDDQTSPQGPEYIDHQ